MSKPYPELKILANIQKNINNKKWICLCDNCSETAINSHLLQRNGILNVITENNHMYEVKGSDYMVWSKNDSPLQFKLVGINNALSHHIFCATHDTDLFYDIEHGVLDCSDYRTQLLFSYRAVCAEIRKKEEAVEFFTRVQNASSLSATSASHAKESIVGYNLGIRDLVHYKRLFETELNNMAGDFEFYHYTFPAIKVYASSVFSFHDGNSSVQNSLNGEIWHTGFIHVIPTASATNIIVGYNKNMTNTRLKKYVASWNGIDNKTLGHKLTDLFTLRIEGWGLAKSLYDQIPANVRKKYINSCTTFAQDYSIDNSVDFNLFESVI